MGVEVLETISRDREEFSRYFHYLKAEIDRESQLIYAHHKGKTEGLEQGKVVGLKQGKAEGLKQGKAEGKAEATIDMIKELQKTVSKAMTVTKLTEEKREEIIRELENRQIPYTL